MPLHIFILVLALSAGMAEARPSLGLRNFRELYHSLQVSLVIHPTPESELAQLYKFVHEQFPQMGFVSEYTSSFQWGLLRLTSEFCKARILMDSRSPVTERWLHKAIDFTSGPKSQGVALNEVNKEYANVFWQRSLRPAEIKELLSLRELSLSELPDVPESMISLLTELCTIQGTSIDSITVY